MVIARAFTHSAVRLPLDPPENAHRRARFGFWRCGRGFVFRPFIIDLHSDREGVFTSRGNPSTVRIAIGGVGWIAVVALAYRFADHS
jgi:hypothetical protein